MRLFGPDSSNRISGRRRGDTSAFDEFTYHVPGHCDVRQSRLEVECFRRKSEFNHNRNNNFITQGLTSIERLKSSYEVGVDNTGTCDFGLCLAKENFQRKSLCLARDNLMAPGKTNKRREKPRPLSYDQSRRSQLFVTSPCDVNGNVTEKSKKVLNVHSSKCAAIKVVLHPEEEWAKNAKTVQWNIKLNRWWKRYCTVTESCAGGKQGISALAKITQNRDGTLTIAGRFKRAENPDFTLHLTARVMTEDIQNGYLMTGALQQGDKATSSMEITHFAAIPKHAG